MPDIRESIATTLTAMAKSPLRRSAIGLLSTFGYQSDRTVDLGGSDPQTVDLSNAYGEKKRKNEKVRGLLRILNSYKFTVVENTPIDQEIVLDPELLGKVFENLLAFSDGIWSNFDWHDVAAFDKGTKAMTASEPDKTRENRPVRLRASLKPSMIAGVTRSVGFATNLEASGHGIHAREQSLWLRFKNGSK